MNALLSRSTTEAVVPTFKLCLFQECYGKVGSIFLAVWVYAYNLI